MVDWEKMALIDLPMKISVNNRGDYYMLTSDGNTGVIVSYFDANTQILSIEDVIIEYGDEIKDE